MAAGANTRLTIDHLETLKSKATRRHYERDSQVFAEGDAADEMYFIESGRVAVAIQEFTMQKIVGSLGPGEYFGEMAFFCGDKRAASVVALEQTVLYCLDRNSFLAIYEGDATIAATFDTLLVLRSDDLTRKETLIDHPGTGSKNLHIGIKGDPSLRESAFSRERYESIADQFLPLLQAQLYDLLLNRDAYEVSIHFNSGEVHVRSVFDPFAESIHPANKLVNKGYVERHFQVFDYVRKGDMVKRVYGFLASDPGFETLRDQERKLLRAGMASWQPVTAAEIVRILARLPSLRKIQNFYIRNFTISTLRNFVRMQFNCDGAHIVSVEQFEAFLDENIPLDDLDGRALQSERRHRQRRAESTEADGTTPLFDRRTPPGRRQSDWEAHVRAFLATSESWGRGQTQPDS